MIRRLGLLFGLAVVLAALLAGWLGVRGMQARDELDSARVSLSQARQALLDQRRPDAARDIGQAGDRTDKAVRLTGDPVFRLAARIPYVGHSVQVVRTVAKGADTIAGQVLPGALAVTEQLDPTTLRAADGTVDIAALERAAPALDRLASSADRVATETGDVPTSGVLDAVERGRVAFAGQLQLLTRSLDNARQAIALAPPLLGADRPRRYFVLVQQTSESRGTGGLPGGFAILEADRGRLRVSDQGSNADLRNGDIPIPPGLPQDYLDLYGDDGVFAIWQNVNLSPDLPTVAKVIEARWRHQSGQRVDGVIALDALALADLLRGSGPVDLGDRRLPPEQLPDYLAIGQYRGVSVRDGQGARKEKLTTVARAATRRITSGGGSNTELLRGLVAAIGSGHLRMASQDPALRPLLRQAGVDGALPQGPAPVAYPVIFNGSAGKLDYFLDRSVRYTAGPCVGTTRRSTVTTTLRNSVPGSGLPPYLTIFTTVKGQQQSYLNGVVLSVYTTRGSEFAGATLDGEAIAAIPLRPGGPILVQNVEGGLQRWHVFLDLPRGQDRTLVLNLDEPVVPGAARVPEQPLARPLRTSVSVPTC